MRGYHFDKLFSIEMNDFEIEGLLPAIFYLIRSSGRQRGKRLDAKEIDKHVRSFVEHKNVSGFDGTEGRRLADKWIRTSLIHTARVGHGRQRGEQILFIRPLSFLSYKPGFPAEMRRLRGAPQFLYQVFHEQLGARKAMTRFTGLERRIREAFAKGLTLPDGPELDGYYDGKTRLDTEVLASLYYLETFESCPALIRPPKKPPPPALLKSASEILAEDIYHFMFAYKQRVPPGVLAEYMLCLLNFELAIYTLKLIHATNTLVRTNKAPQEMKLVASEDENRSPTDLEFYMDITGRRDSASGRMAHANVNRDLEALQEFFVARLTLRTLERYAEYTSDIQDELSSLEGGAYFETLLSHREDIRTAVRADMELDAIRKTLEEDISENASEQSTELPSELQIIFQNKSLDSFSKVIRILEYAQKNNGVINSVSWFWSVCGLKRDDGFLEGNLRGRRIWRYHMSDLLLEVLVQLCTVLPEYNGGNRFPRQVTLVRFLEFLRNRYGILIDRPPEWLINTENITGAKDNFEGLKLRLRQMGLFVDLSDDFNAQRIHPRYTDMLEKSV